MNKLIQTFLLGIIIFSCSKVNKVNYVIISGKVSNQQINKGILTNDKDTFAINIVNNSFCDTLKISEGYYNLGYGKREIPIYLKPGFDLQIQLDKSAKFSGKGAAENNYLTAQAAQSIELEKYFDEKYYARLDEKIFLNLMDSIYHIQTNLFNKNKKEFDSQFNFIEKNKLKYKCLYQKAHYEVAKKILTGKMDFCVSSDYYPNLFKDIDPNDHRLLDNVDYLNMLDSYIWQTTKSKPKNNDSADFYLTYMQILNNAINDTLVKEKLSFYLGNTRLEKTNKLDEVFQLISKNISNKEYFTTVESKYKVLKKIEKGAISPTFCFKDVNGKEVALENLKGKIVYIDIWSTRCEPCMAEIPYLKKIEEYYKGKNICFVGINILDTEEDWKNTVKGQNLPGIQLHAPDPKVAFFKDYLVRGIPRYILIDKEGRILNCNAVRPLDSKVKDQFEEIL